MRYYYAVVFCDARKTARRILDEYSGFEVELTNIRLNLSVVPDELEFPQALKEEASEIPADYNFDGGKISRALNHSTVKLTWDQTDPKRLQKLQQNAKMLTKRKKPVDTDDEDAAYRDLIASDSGEHEYDSEVQSNAEDQQKEQAHIDKMRQLLLGSISQDPADDRQRRKDIQADSDEELDVKFGVGFGGDIGKELLDKKQERKEREGMSDFQKWQERKAERRRDKKKEFKEKQREQRKMARMTEAQLIEHNKQKASLELLIGQKTSKSIVEVDKNDARFVTSDGAFAVDPTHKDYRKVVQGHNKHGHSQRKRM